MLNYRWLLADSQYPAAITSGINPRTLISTISSLEQIVTIARSCLTIARVCFTPLYAGPNVHIGPSLRQPQIPLHLAQRARCEGVNMLILRGRLSLRWMVCANSYFTRIRDSNATAALAACSGFEPSACALRERPESQRDPGSSSSASGSRRMNSLTVRARHAARTPGWLAAELARTPRASARLLVRY